MVKKWRDSMRTRRANLPEGKKKVFSTCKGVRVKLIPMKKKKTK